MKNITFCFAVLFATSALALETYNNKVLDEGLIYHSGGTDKCGCHYNRKTGEYHCHTRKQRGGDCPA